MPSRLCIPLFFLGVLVSWAESDGIPSERGRIRGEKVTFNGEDFVRRILSIATDARGRIVGANGQVRIYDGFTSRELVLPRPAHTGAVAVDGRNRIWVGNPEEMGWFEERSDGEWTFTSIHAELPAVARNYGLLWAVHCIGDTVIFVASHQVMIWREGRFTLRALPTVRRLFSSTWGRHAYVWQRTGDEGGTTLWRFGADGAGEAIGFLPGLFSGYDVLAVDDEGIEFVSEMLAQRYDFETKRLSQLVHPQSTQGTLISAIAGVQLADGQRIIGTGSSGILGYDAAGRLAWAANVASGELPDNGIEGLIVGASGMLWGISQRGLVGLEADSAITSWRAEEGAPVVVNALARFEGRLLVGTSNGLFRLTPGPPGGVARFELENRNLANDLVHFGPGLLMVSGVHSRTMGPRVWRVTPFSFEAGRDAFQPVEHKDLLVWSSLKEVRVLQARVDPLASSGWTTVWSRDMALVDRIAPWRGLEFVVASSSGSIELLSLRRIGDSVQEVAPSRQLAPVGGIGRVLRFEHRAGWLLAVTRNGVWRWRDSLAQFEPLPTDAPPGLVPFAFHFDRAGKGWAVASLARDAMGDTEGTRQVLLPVEWRGDQGIRGLAGSPVGVVDDIGRLTCVFSEEGVWWLGGTGGLARVDLAVLARRPQLRLATAPYIASLRLGEDVSARDQAAMVAGAGSRRSLEVEFGFPRHTHRLPVGFETRLEPLEEEWSPITTERRHAYANLAGGNYVLAARVVDAAGQRSPELRLPVQVQVYFRESVWFPVVLVLGIMLLGGAGVAGWTRRLRRRKAELEHIVGKRTAALLATNEELRLQNLKRVELIGAVSHELRTPLTGAYFMAEKLATNGPIEAEQLRGCLAELRTLLEGTLDVSRYELGLIPVQLRWIRPEQVVTDVVQLFRPLAAARGLACESDLATAPGPVLADEPNLRRILANLISNAVKYTEQGGVTVTMRWDAGAGRLGWAEYRVRDTGPGLDAGKVAGLFTGFHRVGLELAANRPSAGLGLALTKQLVDLAGGGISCTSQPGIGTEFCVRLPVVVAATNAEPEAPFATEVLVVEDEAAQRDHAVELLEPLGAVVTVAGSMADALGHTKHRLYALALVDFNLPDGTGLELLQRWKAEGVTPSRVVMLSAHRSEQIRDICLDAGFADVLIKPLSVRAAIEQLGASEG